MTRSWLDGLLKLNESRASAVSFHETVYLFGGIISDFGTEESNSVSIYEHDAWVIQGILSIT